MPKKKADPKSMANLCPKLNNINAVRTTPIPPFDER